MAPPLLPRRISFTSAALSLALASAGCSETFVVAEDGGTGGSSSTQSSVSEEGLLLWLRADEGVLANDGQVTLWRDQSSALKRDASQVIVGKRPSIETASGAAPVITFDGIDDELAVEDGFLNFEGGLTIFVAAQPSPTSGCWSFVYLGNGGESDDITVGMWQDKFLFEVDSNFIQPPTPIATGEKVLVTALLNDTNAMLRVNGDGVATGTFGAARQVLRVLNSVGGPSYDECVNYKGSLAEILVYGRPLPLREIEAIEAELRDRWK